MNRLQKFLCPRKIALIGASRKKEALGGMFLNAVQRMNYPGEIIPVNPKATEINGLACTNSITELPSDLDLAVIMLPYRLVLSTVEELAERGIENILIVSAGFKEVGGDGIVRENQLKALIEKYNLNVVGPNCMGFVNTDPAVRLNASFSPLDPKPGHVAFISQSGALGVSLMELSMETQLEFSIFGSTGNKVDIDEVDFLEFLLDDKNTHSVMLYHESLNRAQELRRVCQRMILKKPIIAIKAGRGKKAQEAASSHTGALASPDVVVDAFLRQCGVIRCETLEDMFDLARGMAVLKPPKGNRVAIITNAGGPAILATDVLEERGMEVPNLSARTQQKLREFLHQEASVLNPIDMIASATHETYRQTFEIVAQDKNVDAILLIMVKSPFDITPGYIIETLADAIKQAKKPVIAVVLAQYDKEAGISKFWELNVPVFRYPESAARVLGGLNEYRLNRQTFREEPHLEIPISTLPASETLQRKQVALQQVFDYLEEYNIPLAPYLISDNLDDIISFTQMHDAAIVLKIANGDVIHKSDLSLVKINLKDEADVRKAFDDIVQTSPEFLPEGIKPIILVQPMIEGFPELVIGAKRDENFGVILMFGLGGVFVEALQDVIFRFAPINRHMAMRMIDEIKSHRLLKGFRHHSPVDLDQIAIIITKVGQLMIHHPEIQEMDINPIIWSPQDNHPFVVDARMTILD
ncbi:MAG: hypothetical protein B6242_01335 [Anaerolineaceae bacterium 4572_78]|nr:MAG: hypothetical protein B6242_01335 [Anaerolineaceae bacterium 4572_78]